MKIQKVVRDGKVWAQAIDDDGVIVDEGLLHDFEAEPVQPDFELPPVKEEEKHKLSKKGKFAIAAIAGGALFTAVIMVRRHKRRERA